VQVCDSTGHVSSTTNCYFGCTMAGGSARCLNLQPSFSVPSPDAQTNDLVVSAPATIDISNCAGNPQVVQLTIGSVTTTVPTQQVLAVNQGGGAVCVVRYHNIMVQSGQTLTVVNSTSVIALSLEAQGTIDIEGGVFFRNVGTGLSPGGSVSSVNTGNDMFDFQRSPGAGGGGNGVAGGRGGACNACTGVTLGGNAGSAITLSSSQIFPGSRGGNVTAPGSSTVIAQGGQGGGALHLVSLQSVTIGSAAAINLTGAGGTGQDNNLPAGGGGSGGTFVVEAASINIVGKVSSNGGGGAGGCRVSAGVLAHSNGQDGLVGFSAALGGQCGGPGNGGAGGGGTAANGAAADSTGTPCGGAGGGGNGYVVLKARDASRIMIAGGSVVSPSAMTGTVVTN
jgi:hypothetical protein